MDVRIEAAPMTMVSSMQETVVLAVIRTLVQAIALIGRVASFPRLLSLGGHSLSAVAPDHIRNGGTAVAV